MANTHRQAQDAILCHRCRHIDFQKMLDVSADDLQAYGRHGYLVSEVDEKVTYLNRAICLLCRFFSIVRILSASSTEILHLRAFSAFSQANNLQLGRLPKALLAADLPHLALVSQSSVSAPTLESDTRFFFCKQKLEESHRVFQPQVLPHEIDYTSIIDALNFCKSKHKFLCSEKERTVGPSRLIDCYTSPPSLVDSPPSAPYVALSYVWGNNGNQKSFQKNYRAEASGLADVPSACLPKTISDAQIVVRKLGYRYLWVDQVCINQSSNSDKSSQISIMDKIYGGAELTIVAAAGSNSEYGLPGVSSTLRQAIPKVELDGVEIICTPSHPHYLIRSSIWASRAWTYQEALLSQRLLCFTEHETYFECHSMQARECMKWEYEALHCKQGKLYSYFNSGLFLRGISCRDSYIRAPNPGLMRYYKLIKEYTARQMTCEEDSLKAFSGITKHLEGCKIPVLQLQGIPFLADKDRDETCKSLLAGLLWIHTGSFRSAIPTRRPGLPFWSWAGWKGQVRFMVDSTTLYTKFNPRAIVTGIMPRNGPMLDMDTLLYNSMEIVLSEPSAIRLRTHMLVGGSFTIRFVKQVRNVPNCRVISELNPPTRPSRLDRPQPVQPSRRGKKPTPREWNPGFKSRLYICKRPRVLTRFPDFFESHKYKALLIGDLPCFSSVKGPGRIYFLIVEPHGDFFSRVGILEVIEDFKTFCKDMMFEERSFILC